jgi:mutator protein MutT
MVLDLDSGMICEGVVTAAIIQRNDFVLLARRSCGQKLAGFWEFPGGKVEVGETPESCLVRELDEELGIEVEVHRKFAESLHQYDHGDFRIIAYIVDWGWNPPLESKALLGGPDANKGHPAKPRKY